MHPDRPSGRHCRPFDFRLLALQSYLRSWLAKIFDPDGICDWFFGVDGFGEVDALFRSEDALLSCKAGELNWR